MADINTGFGGGSSIDTQSDTSRDTSSDTTSVSDRSTSTADKQQQIESGSNPETTQTPTAGTGSTGSDTQSDTSRDTSSDTTSVSDRSTSTADKQQQIQNTEPDRAAGIEDQNTTQRPDEPNGGGFAVSQQARDFETGIVSNRPNLTRNDIRIDTVTRGDKQYLQASLTAQGLNKQQQYGNALFGTETQLVGGLSYGRSVLGRRRQIQHGTVDGSTVAAADRKLAKKAAKQQRENQKPKAPNLGFLSESDRKGLQNTARGIDEFWSNVGQTISEKGGSPMMTGYSTPASRFSGGVVTATGEMLNPASIALGADTIGSHLQFKPSPKGSIGYRATNPPSENTLNRRQEQANRILSQIQSRPVQTAEDVAAGAGALGLALAGSSVAEFQQSPSMAVGRVVGTGAGLFAFGEGASALGSKVAGGVRTGTGIARGIAETERGATLSEGATELGAVGPRPYRAGLADTFRPGAGTDIAGGESTAAGAVSESLGNPSASAVDALYSPESSYYKSAERGLSSSMRGEGVGQDTAITRSQPDMASLRRIAGETTGREQLQNAAEQFGVNVREFAAAERGQAQLTGPRLSETAVSDTGRVTDNLLQQSISNRNFRNFQALEGGSYTGAPSPFAAESSVTTGDVAGATASSESIPSWETIMRNSGPAAATGLLKKKQKKKKKENKDEPLHLKMIPTFAEYIDKKYTEALYKWPDLDLSGGAQSGGGAPPNNPAVVGMPGEPPDDSENANAQADQQQTSPFNPMPSQMQPQFGGAGPGSGLSDVTGSGARSNAKSMAGAAAGAMQTDRQSDAQTPFMGFQQRSDAAAAQDTPNIQMPGTTTAQPRFQTPIFDTPMLERPPGMEPPGPGEPTPYEPGMPGNPGEPGEPNSPNIYWPKKSTSKKKKGDIFGIGARRGEILTAFRDPLFGSILEA